MTATWRQPGQTRANLVDAGQPQATTNPGSALFRRKARARVVLEISRDRSATEGATRLEPTAKRNSGRAPDVLSLPRSATGWMRKVTQRLDELLEFVNLGRVPATRAERCSLTDRRRTS